MENRSNKESHRHHLNNRFNEITNIISNRYPEAKNIVVEKSRYGIPNIAEASLKKDPKDISTSVEYFIIDKSASPRQLCDNPNLRFLETAYHFCQTNIQAKNFKEFFWTLVEQKFPILFPDGANGSNMISYSLHFSILVLDNFLKTKGIDNLSDEEIILYFSQEEDKYSLETLKELILERRKYINSELKKEHEKQLIEEARNKAIASYEHLSNQVAQYREEAKIPQPRRNQIPKIDRFKYSFDSKYYFDGGGINTYMLAALNKGFDLLSLYSSQLLENSFPDQEILDIASELDRQTLLKLILEIFETGSDCINKYLRLVNTYYEDYFLEQMSIFENDMYKIFVDTIIKHQNSLNTNSVDQSEQPDEGSQDSDSKFFPFI